MRDLFCHVVAPVLIWVGAGVVIFYLWMEVWT